MPKRKTKDKIEYYKSKLRKLENKSRRRIRRLSPSSDSEQETRDTNSIGIGDPVTMSSVIDAEPGTSMEAPNEGVTGPEVCMNSPGDNNVANSSTVPVLDPSILAALGEITDETPEFGEKIHENLVQIWSPLSKQGMSKDNREVLLKNYLIPENCTWLQAPILNPEISAAIPESGRARDKKMAATQRQLGVGITAINRGLHLLIHDGSKIEAIKFISDGCRILSDLHHQNTETRIKFILPGLDKSFLQFLERTERDNTLFGSDLSEKIKASKTIVKQGELIKKALPPPKPSTSNNSRAQPNANRSSYQGNWQGPPRSQPNRGGGRGGHKRTSYRIPTSTSQSKTSHTYKPRELSPSSTQPSYAGCGDTLREAFLRRNIPVQAIDLMLASLSDNTKKQYSVSYKLWWQFCKTNNMNIFDSTVAKIISFLTEEFNKGASYGSLNSHRSALSLLLGNNIGSDECIKRLLKGAYKLKPSRPKYTHTWDPQIVLNHISNWYPNRD
ncbi:unnamed protein product, partial [Brenthis ino]